MLLMDLTTEFERQIQSLLEKGYPTAAGLTITEFLKHVEPLKEKLKHISTTEVDLEKGTLPFVLVVKSDLVPTEKAMKLTERDGKTGITKLYPLKPENFEVIKEVEIPKSPLYLLVDIDRGKETLNIRPSEALEIIEKGNRSPLTIDEGVALVTHFPDFLKKNNCFSLLASRHPGDKRVPAIWINAQKHPNLGWCWDGNPHTWLGSASCKSRF